MAVALLGSVLRFGEFELDCGRFELRRKGQPLRLERKPMELLILLASREGQLVTRTEIAERLWSSEIFVDTEHGINTAIRKLRYLLRDDPDDPHFIQTVTGMGYRFVAPIITAEPLSAEPPNAPEIDPAATPSTPYPAQLEPVQLEPAQLEQDAPESAPAPTDAVPRKHRPWLTVALSAVILIAILVIALGFHSQVARILHRNTAPAINSLAVLPLDNLSGDPNQDYFAEGMTDELITMLAKDSTLRITSRTSVMRFKGARRPLPEIARELGVDGILEGSIARSGNQIHMTLQLIRADADAHLWAESYDRSLSDLSSLPDDAARQVAKLLRQSAAAVKQPRYVNPEAHDAYMRAHYLWFTDRIEESGAYYRKAIEIQPDYAAAWAGLADYCGAGIVDDVLDPRTNIAPEERAAERALQLDPDLAQAHQAMAAMFLIDRWDWFSADREIQHAIRLDPGDAELYNLRARVLLALNRDADAIESEKRSMELDPFARPYALAAVYRDTRQYDAELAEIRLRLEANPNNPDLGAEEMDMFRRMGNYRQAVDLWARWHVLMGDPQSAANLRRAYEQGGVRGFVRWELGRSLRQSKSHYVSPVELAGYYAQLGDKEHTLALLEDGYRQHSTDILWIQRDPAFDFLHSDPRYRAIIQRTGIPPTY
jgi:TolB-like protein/DNA-binding winged helix-turn-helix (wHTH) protein